MQSWTVQIRKGLIELCVMAALREGETYGYQLLQRLRNIAALSISESTVYPLLARLTREGMVTVRDAPSPTGPPRRYYRLTPLGRSRLRQMENHWQSVQNNVSALLGRKSK